IPFVFLTARTLDSDVRYGKELGVDDYLTKPIRANDLLAIVRGRLRRAQQLAESMEKMVSTRGRLVADPNERFLEVGALKVDTEQHRVWVGDTEVKLSAKEFALLEYLARQQGKIASPQELIKITHELETDHVEAGALLRPLILSIRRKLGSDVGEMGLIKNVRGVGYRLAVPDE
ncbi:MAG: response regulator transcription factor, partial [Anaerolineae bacterium]|nr:response regulator transcription factor [Anaerolineae bacterium]